MVGSCQNDLSGPRVNALREGERRQSRASGRPQPHAEVRRLYPGGFASSKSSTPEFFRLPPVYSFAERLTFLGVEGRTFRNYVTPIFCW